MDLVGKVSFFLDLLCFEPKISTWALLFLLSFVVVTGYFGNIITVWFRRKLSEVRGGGGVDFPFLVTEAR
jgi:hypothetical protein